MSPKSKDHARHKKLTVKGYLQRLIPPANQNSLYLCDAAIWRTHSASQPPDNVENNAYGFNQVHICLKWEY